MTDQIEQMGITIESYQKVCFLNKNYIVLFKLTSACLLLSLQCLIFYFFLVCFNQQLEDMRNKYDDQVRQCSDLSNKLDTTEV